MAAEKLITEHLNLWTAAIKRRSIAGRGSSKKVELYGIKKLRELILELAVRGLLVPQDSKDEPASELLKKIAAEKAKMVKEGKIKKEKPLPPVSDDEKAFDLPRGWEWSRLQNVSEYIQRGKGPDYADSGRVRVISQKCVQWAGFDISASRFVDDASLGGYGEERFLKKDDLLWNSTGTGTVGRINVVDIVAEELLVADSHVTVVRTLKVHAKYFLAYVSSAGVQSRIEPTHGASLVSGSTQQVELNTSAVILLPVPVPPIDEQHRIVAKVDELMALCDQLEQQTDASLSAHQTLVETLLNALNSAADHTQFASAWLRIAEHFDTLFTTEESIDQLKQTILQLAVMGKLVIQDPNDEPASELLKRIAGEKAKLVKEGKIKKDKPQSAIAKQEKPFDAPTGWSLVRFGDLLINRDSERIPLSVDERATRRGDYDYFGASGVIDSIDDFLFDKPLLLIGEDGANLINRSTPIAFMARGRYWVNNHAHVLDGYSEELLLYVCLFINAISLESYITGSAQPKMNQAKMNGIVLSLPPLAEQHRILARVDELMALCDQLKSRLSEAQTTQLHLADALAEQALAGA